MSDRLVTAPAHWGWLVVLYFFLGGIAAGTYLLAAMLDLFGSREDRATARLGYLVSFPALALCPPLLILDLDKPRRFWHLFWMSQRPGLMFKWWSPISIGSWALLAFSACSFASFLAALADAGEEPRFGRAGDFMRALRRGALGKVLAVLGGGCAFFVAGYTGVLLSVTNRPIWADTPLLGALFLVSSATASAALLSFLADRQVGISAASWRWLHRVEKQAAMVEIVVLAAFLVVQGRAVRMWLGPNGLMLAAAVVLGLLAPLAVRRRAAPDPKESPEISPLLVVGSSLLIRAAVVFAAEAVRRA